MANGQSDRDVNMFGVQPSGRKLRVCDEIIWTLCCWPPGPLARRERRAIPGAVCEERATKPAGRSPEGAAAKGAYRLCCRSSTMSDIAFVAAPRICPPGARAKVSILFRHRPLPARTQCDLKAELQTGAAHFTDSNAALPRLSSPFAERSPL